MILINKVDLVEKNNLGVLIAFIKKINPRAKLIQSNHGKVDPKEILNTKLFNYEEAEQSAGWIEELKKEKHTPETEEYGIGSFVFRDKRPFHAVRFWNYVQNDFPISIIRSKGLFWISSRPAQAMSWGQAGGSLKADSEGVWWSSMPLKARLKFPVFIEYHDQIQVGWDKVFGDRKNELVFIGQDLEKEQILSDLEACLCSPEEIEAIDWENGSNDDWPVERAIPPHKQSLIP